jgi:DNA adenine methylase
MTEDMLRPSAQEDCLPFLKWAGGKRWFVNQYFDIIPADFGRYIEPFLGSGALFFALQPKRAVLSDLNADLVETFAAIKEEWKTVVSFLRKYHHLHSASFYYRVRSSRPSSRAARAARFIYLNRTCWNGLYRVNNRGQFNVPVGTKENVLLDSDDFCRTSALLKRVALVTSDFEAVISSARRGDLIFADPPYVTAHSQNGFLKYNEKLFSWNDQVRLVECLNRAKGHGVQVLATNADTPSIRKLYEESFTVRTANRSSRIAASPARRGISNELVITSW